VRDVRRDRVQRAQQDAETSRSATASPAAPSALEVLQRVEHLHGAGDHGVVLHALVVVVHLLEHGVDLQAQALAALPKTVL
jgi:hypothetical protein